MEKQLSIPTQEPTIQIINNQLMVSSLDVAEKFCKRHDNVVRAIKGLDIPEDFTALNFEASAYVDSTGKENLCYNMTRDGFVILVMGFTGKEAMQWKIRYIQAFNAMEAELLQKPQQLQLDAPSTKEDRRPLSNLVNTLVSAAPIRHRDAWHMVHAHMGGKHADELTLAEVQTALEFVQSKIDMYCATPEVDFITRQALAGVKAFTARLTVEEAISKTAKAAHREFKANIYITEEKPKHEIAAYLDTMTDAHQKRLNRAGIR